MTEKLYYKDQYLKIFDAIVISCEEKGNHFIIELDSTAFYPEGGGQPADQGKMNDAFVSDVHEKDGRIFHTVDKAFAAGSKVHCELDWNRRFNNMQQHSGEHIVSGMLCSRFGCDNIGFHMGSAAIQIDYNADISWEEALKVEEEANNYIWENHDFIETWPSKDELKQLSYRSKKELSGAVRIASFPGADVCACCGTHVKTSSEVGLVKLLSIQKIKEGVRIEMLSGRRAFEYLSDIFNQNQGVSRELSAKPVETLEAVQKIKNELFETKGRLHAIEDAYMKEDVCKYEGSSNPVVILDNASPEFVRKYCDMLSNITEGTSIVFGGSDGDYKYAIVNKENDIFELVKEINERLNGRGGGKKGFAQGSVACKKEQIEAFLEQKHY